MSMFLIILLVIFFGYSLALVLTNNNEVAVNLLFSQLPNTNLGLVLIATITLGVFIGVLLALLIFKVLQNKLEIRKLHKDVALLESKLKEANIAIEQNRIALAQTQATQTMPEPTLNTTFVPPQGQ
ncbi:LapA family protein [Moraxella oblonga]|uniref:LapA family protein n=1 Tax=Moraxella oblonga TaxID=200413 RepID=UPI000834D312|nr:LapA family protein [Moraxella oblonga]